MQRQICPHGLPLKRCVFRVGNADLQDPWSHPPSGRTALFLERRNFLGSFLRYYHYLPLLLSWYYRILRV